MEYRIGINTIVGAQKYKKKVNALVLYLGRERLRMKDNLDAGSATVKYVIIDIRDFDAETLLAGGPGDWALALAGEGQAGEEVGALSGLRRLSKKFKMEVKKMGVYIDIEENVFLKDIRDQGLARGRAEGKAETLREQLEMKFGSLPVWARERLNAGRADQMQVWTRKVLTARSLQGVLGRE